MKIFGANWQTSVSGIGGYFLAFVTWLSTISYDQGFIATVIPFAYKGYVTWIAAFCSLALLAWNAIQQKSKNVTGGTIQQTTGGAVADEGTQALVDQTVIASIKSGDTTVTPEQRQAVRNVSPN